MSDLASVLNLDDLRARARRRLPRIVFDFIEGGADDETCLERNRAGFQRYALLPRYLVDVSTRSRSVDFLGHRYDAPYGISPMGHTGLARPGADLMLASVAAQANIPYLISSASNASLEQAVQRAPRNTWFQIYACTDESINRDLLRRAQSLAVGTLVVTVDVPVNSNRERNRRNGFGRPPRLSASTVAEALLHPRWLLDFYRAGGIPPMGNWLPYSGEPPSSEGAAARFAQLTPDSRLTWDRLERLREQWPGHLLLKGILDPADATRAAQLGVDGLIISNHGGRQFDPAPASIEMLPFIRRALGEQMPLVLDGGIRRGSDIVKAFALGANLVLAGRPWLYGAAVAGARGVEHVAALLARELDLTMGQAGIVALNDIDHRRLWAPGDAGLAALSFGRPGASGEAAAP